MSSETRRFAPRSAVSGADLETLTRAVIEFDALVDDAAPSVAELARRLIRFRVAPTEAVVQGLVILGPIGLD